MKIMNNLSASIMACLNNLKRNSEKMRRKKKKDDGFGARNVLEKNFTLFLCGAIQVEMHLWILDDIGCNQMVLKDSEGIGQEWDLSKLVKPRGINVDPKLIVYLYLSYKVQISKCFMTSV